METLKAKWKRYLVSSIVTFVATFLLISVPELLDDSFVWSNATVGGVFVAATRLGVKAVWEILAPWLLSFKK